jgi:hypothetical protein
MFHNDFYNEYSRRFRKAKRDDYKRGDFFTSCNFALSFAKVMDIELGGYREPEKWGITDQCVFNAHKRKVLIVGSNPSQKSPDNSPFHKNTASFKRVSGWFSHLNVELHFINLVDEKTENNKQLTKTQIKPHLADIVMKTRGYNKIVACGNIASMGLDMANVDHFTVPHPSGVNRFWNCPRSTYEKLTEMLDYVYDRE